MMPQAAPLPFAPPRVRLTSEDVCECIRAHYGFNGEKYAYLFEVRNGAAWAANRSVDAVVMGLWPSLGLHLAGMEIKVSRSDWLSELSNPKKASDVIGYFDKWYLVAPEGVAKIEEIPEPWGWMAPNGGKLRELKPAPLNKDAQPLSRSILSCILRNHARQGEHSTNRAIEHALQEQKRRHDDEIERRTLHKMGDLREDAASWAKLRDALKGQPRDFIYSPDVIEAVRIVIKAGVGKSYGGLRSMLSESQRFLTALSAVADELGVKLEEPTRRKSKR